MLEINKYFEQIHNTENGDDIIENICSFGKIGDIKRAVFVFTYSYINISY